MLSAINAPSPPPCISPVSSRANADTGFDSVLAHRLVETRNTSVAGPVRLALERVGNAFARALRSVVNVLTCVPCRNVDRGTVMSDVGHSQTVDYLIQTWASLEKIGRITQDIGDKNEQARTATTANTPISTLLRQELKNHSLRTAAEYCRNLVTVLRDRLIRIEVEPAARDYAVRALEIRPSRTSSLTLRETLLNLEARPEHAYLSHAMPLIRNLAELYIDHISTRLERTDLTQERVAACRQALHIEALGEEDTARLSESSVGVPDSKPAVSYFINDVHDRRAEVLEELSRDWASIAENSLEPTAPRQVARLVPVRKAPPPPVGFNANAALASISTKPTLPPKPAWLRSTKISNVVYSTTIAGDSIGATGSEVSTAPALRASSSLNKESSKSADFHEARIGVQHLKGMFEMQL